MANQKYSCVIFDLDGVITNTASIHATAWKCVFDIVLKKKNPKNRPFDIKSDYLDFVDGKSRQEGINAFLESRNLKLLDGHIDDLTLTTVRGLSNIKNIIYRNLLESSENILCEDSLKLINLLSSNKIPIAVASSSKNCKYILDKYSLMHRFDYVIGGDDLDVRSLRSKPSSDIFDHVVQNLFVDPSQCIVIEDAPAGVTAASKAKVGLILGLERNGSKELKSYGANHVIESLDELDIEFLKNGEFQCSIKRS